MVKSTPFACPKKKVSKEKRAPCITVDGKSAIDPLRASQVAVRGEPSYVSAANAFTSDVRR
ncbi:MAG: hypothetical protein P1U47_07085, partial [Zhongshania sp.]|uniref:hypothetical protein n=1 Tax=Zhongshania sp. TaxID=1971902 RepID=UPI002626774B